MKQLEKLIKTNGSTYKLLRRSETVTLYEQYMSDNLVAYELSIVKTREAESFKGVDLPTRECFPSNQDFGVSAWSLPVLLGKKEVIRRFEDLNTEVERHIEECKLNNETPKFLGRFYNKIKNNNGTI